MSSLKRTLAKGASENTASWVLYFYCCTLPSGVLTRLWLCPNQERSMASQYDWESQSRQRDHFQAVWEVAGRSLAEPPDHLTTTMTPSKLDPRTHISVIIMFPTGEDTYDLLTRWKPLALCQDLPHLSFCLAYRARDGVEVCYKAH